MSAFNTPWLRLWSDMPNDPKWRTIARVSEQTIPAVIAVYLHILVNAGSAEERGHMHHFVPEDIAGALQIDTEQVQAILAAMQGRVLDGDRVSGWAARQPLREDGSAQRAKAWRDAKKTSGNIIAATSTAKARTEPEPASASASTPAPVSQDRSTARPLDTSVDRPVDMPDTPVVLVCAALLAHGITDIETTHPEIPALLAQGADTPQFVAAAKIAKAKRKGFAYVMGIVRRKLADAHSATPVQSARPNHANRPAPVPFNVTTPSPPGLDPALAKIMADQRIPRSGPSAEVRAKMAALTRRPASPVQATTLHTTATERRPLTPPNATPPTLFQPPRASVLAQRFQ